MKTMKGLLLAVLLTPCLAHAGALGNLPGPYYLGDTVIIDWDSFSSTGASSATTGLATGDIKVYKYCGTGSFSITEFSNSGYTLVDTDGLDVDGRTGFNAVALDTSDTGNTWTSGCDYLVHIDNVTIDSQTVRMTARFKLDPNGLSFGTLSADSASTSTAKVGTSGLAADNQYVTRIIWNVTTNEKQCITASDDNTVDLITFSPSVPTIWHSGDRYRIISGDVPCFPVTLPNLTAGGDVIVGAFVDATHPVDATMADSWRNLYKNGSVTSTLTLDTVANNLTAIKTETDLIGTPPDLGYGATIAGNQLALSGSQAYGTCTSGSTQTCVNASLTQAESWWNNWNMILFPGTTLPPRCVRAFTASSDTISWPQVLPSTASGQKFVLMAAAECRNVP